MSRPELADPSAPGNGARVNADTQYRLVDRGDRVTRNQDFEVRSLKPAST
jgi:hypothetical protein